MAIKGKKRKPLSEGQKQERRDRLAIAREQKTKPKYVSVAANVRELKDEDPLSLKNTRKHIKSNKDERQRLRKILRTSKDRKTLSRYNNIDTYIQNMEYYLRNGIWLDLFYGEQQENKVGFKSLTLAYDSDGMIKRTVNCFYPDIGGLYTQEMQDTDMGVFDKVIKKRAIKKKKKRTAK
jgi:hypothetical protein